MQILVRFSLLPFLALTAAAAPAYFVRDLGAAGTVSYARSVNNAGEVAGTQMVNGAQHAVLFAGGGQIDLGTLPGGATSAAAAINANGDVVGSAKTAAGAVHAVLFSHGVVVDLGGLDAPPFDSSLATGINDAGNITGIATVGRNGRPVNHGFVYSNGTLQDVGTPPGEYRVEPTFMPRAINARGDIAGAASDADGLGDVLTVYSSNVGGWLDIPGVPSGGGSVTDMNDRGAIIGFFTSGDHSHGFVAAGGTTVDLGLVDGFTDLQPNAINSGGSIVGRASTTATGWSTAFVYTNGALLDLNRNVTLNGDTFARLTEATAINDGGQIAGFGQTMSGETHAFLLTPLPATAASPRASRDDEQ